jgi:hypothetical protein
MNSRLVFVQAVCALTALVSAQQSDKVVRSPELLRAELDACKRDLELRRSDADRLLDLRIRHDLGLPTDNEVEWSRPVATVSLVPGKAPDRQLAEEEAATGLLQARLDKLKLQVDRIKAENLAKAPKPKGDEWVTIPVPGTTSANPSSQPQNQVAAPTGETKPSGGTNTASLQVVANLDPVRAQIDGSQDHARVANALLKAGQSLMDRAESLRRQGQAAAADQCDDAARERLQRATRELAPVDGQEPPLADLFCLGKCREMLFRIAERREGLSLSANTSEYQRREQEVREPFLAITARDVEVRDGHEQPGVFGRAAQTALEHFRWVNLHRGFATKTPLDSITWPQQAPK